MKLILTDVDGVLLDWELAFHEWMKERGYKLKEEPSDSYIIHHHYNDLTEKESKLLVRYFNESATIGYLKPLRDSIKYVKLLTEKHGYKFNCITSLSSDPYAYKLRLMNLRSVFGDAINDLVCLDTGADKDEALAPYKDSGLWWIEDKPANADLGHKLGLRSILIEHEHNVDHKCPYPIVENWSEIYKLIVG